MADPNRTTADGGDDADDPYADDPYGATFVQPKAANPFADDAPPEPAETRPKRADPSATVAESDDDRTAEAERRLARYAKADADLAVAAVLVEQGLVNDRELTKSVTDWTVHGERTLVDHLITRGLVPEAERTEVITRAADRLRRASASRASANSSMLGKTLSAHIDKGGKVSKALGLGDNSVPLDEREGRQLATRYTLLRKLGQGGLGTVWLARDEALNRFVAVKEVRQEASADPAAVARFRREAEVTGRLEHPGIVPIYQFGTDEESGNLFYAMRFLGKQTLADAIAEYHERREADADDPLLLNNLLTAFVSVCQSVAHAHSRKIIHRDLKPENVALDAFGQVVLLDWGLAKINDETGLYEAGGGEVESGDVHDSGATVAGQVLGTPMFMAPEQAAGRLEELDERTDVYGLGAILFAILTGFGPHEANRQRASGTMLSGGGGGGGMASVLTSIVSGPTPRVLDHNPDAPKSLDAIAAKAMAKRRFLRYESAAQLADDVKRAMIGQTVTAMRDTASVKFRRWVQEHPKTARVVGSAAVIAVVALATFGFSTRQAVLAAERREAEVLRTEAGAVETGLKNHAINLRRNTRFVAGLPPIQGIIDARSGRETDGEEVWRARLSKIFTLLTEANPSYLSVSYLTYGVTVDEIVRVERGRAGEGVRVVPRPRLRSYTRAGRARYLFDRPPETVDVDHLPLFPVEAASGPTRTVVTAATPVLDAATGRPFGLVAIETAPGDYLSDILEMAVRDARAVALTDETDTTLAALDGDGERRPDLFGANVAAILPLPDDDAPADRMTVMRVIDIEDRRGGGQIRVYLSAAGFFETAGTTGLAGRTGRP